MYVPEFWAGFVAGVVTGWAGLLGLVYGAARWQQKNNRRPK